MPDITIDFSGITIPAHEEFSMSMPSKQRENFAYVMLQVLDILRQNAFTITLPENQAVVDLETLLTDIKDAIRGATFGTELESLWLSQQEVITQQSNFAGYIVGLSNPNWFALTVWGINYMNAIIAENNALVNMLATPENYTYRQNVIEQHDRAIQAMVLLAIAGHLSDTKKAIDNIETAQAVDYTDLLTDVKDNIADLKFNGQQVTYSTKDAKVTIDFMGQYVNP